MRAEAGSPGRRLPIRLDPVWVAVGGCLIAAAALLAFHLTTGRTPARVAFTVRVAGFDFAVYWYGVVIMTGIILGSWVTSRLAEERARSLFEDVVAAETRAQLVAGLDLPADVVALLARRKVTTVGELLFRWGLEPGTLGLNAAGLDLTRAALQETPGVDAAWLTLAPWRVWSPEHVWAGLMWCVVLGIIGARLYHVLTPSPSMAPLGITSPLDYFRHPLQLINIRNGGLGIYGALVGGLVGLILYTRRQHLPWLAWADLAAVGLPLGQFVGRWGNFFNQELYGRPTTLPWGITIDRPPGDFGPDVRFHPAFLYESLWNLLGFCGLYLLARRRAAQLRSGELMGLYLVWYGIGRILLETVRLDSRMVSIGGWTLPVASAVSGVIILVILSWMGVRRWRAANPPEQ